MDFSFSQADVAFRSEVQAFLCEKLPPDIKHRVDNGVQVPGAELIRWHKVLYEQGWIAPNWPKEHGGTGWTVTQKYIYDEECGLTGAPRVIGFGLTMCGPVLMAFGTPEQKAHYLPRILSADDIWCQGYSEPGAGSDLASLKTKAEPDGDHWVVNGSKIWTTHAHNANMIFCLVRTSTAGKRQEGISFLLIDMKAPGIEVKPLITIEGMHEVNEVFFTDVRVPKENMVGEPGEGWTIAKYLLGHERLGGGSLGPAKKLLSQLKEIAADQLDGQRVPLIEDATFRRKMAEVEIELMALEFIVLRVLASASADREVDAKAGSSIKIRRTEIMQRLTELKLEAVGNYGVPFVLGALKDGWNEEPIGPEYANSISALYFNNRKLSIFAGSNEIQHNIIAKRVLGL